MDQQYELEQKLKEVLHQEKDLIFPSFSNQTAFDLGMLLIETAKKRNVSIAIDIEINRCSIFSYKMQGTVKENEVWIRRKQRLTRLNQHSSYYSYLMLQSRKQSIKEAWYLDPARFAAYGGSFPIRLSDGLVIGTVSISGCPHEEDHALLIHALFCFLNPAA